MKTYEISCDICRDIIPLVKDGIASDDSVSAVKKHIDNCENCRKKFGQEIEATTNIQENRLINSIKIIVIIWTIIIISMSVIVSTFITPSRRSMALQIVGLPILMLFCCILLGKKRIVLPASVIISRLAVFAARRRRDIYHGNFFTISREELLSHILILVLCFVGVIIYQLVKFAVSENKH